MRCVLLVLLCDIGWSVMRASSGVSRQWKAPQFESGWAIMGKWSARLFNAFNCEWSRESGKTRQ